MVVEQYDVDLRGGGERRVSVPVAVWLADEQLEGRFTVVGVEHVVAGRLQDLDLEHTHDGVILDDEHPSRPPSQRRPVHSGSATSIPQLTRRVTVVTRNV